MSDLESLEALGYQPVDVTALQESSKFLTGPILHQDGTRFFLKMVKDPTQDSWREDLANEVQWNYYVWPHISPEAMWTIPEVVVQAADSSWAVFDYAEGRTVDELNLPLAQLADLALMAADVARVPLGREGADVKEWYKRRMQKFGHVLQSHYFDSVPETRERFRAMTDGAVDLSSLTAGMIHGDFNLKNIIKVPDDLYYLVDAEFGTATDRPEWDKPRYHDIAYFYHLLLCQYRQPERAEAWYALAREFMALHLGSEVEASFDTEFYLSVLERTMSMMDRFIINPDPHKIIDDPRRRAPAPYVDIINEALTQLSIAEQ